MNGAALGLLLGLAVGGVNQFLMWWAVYRAKPRRGAGLIARYLGGCAVRLGLDALALYLAWRWTGAVAGIVTAAAGLLIASGAFTWWQYRLAQGRRRLVKGGRTGP